MKLVLTGSCSGPEDVLWCLSSRTALHRNTIGPRLSSRTIVYLIALRSRIARVSLHLCAQKYNGRLRFKALGKITPQAVKLRLFRHRPVTSRRVTGRLTDAAKPSPNGRMLKNGLIHKSMGRQRSKRWRITYIPGRALNVIIRSPDDYRPQHTTCGAAGQSG